MLSADVTSQSMRRDFRHPATGGRPAGHGVHSERNFRVFAPQLDLCRPAPFGVAGVSQIEFTVDANGSGPYATEVPVGPPGNVAVSNQFFVYAEAIGR
jgi:hypothetical protein